jgi:hypothetical protein
MRLVGPVAHFRGQKGTRWQLAVLLVLDAADPAPPPLLAADTETPASRIALRGDWAFWRYEFSLELGPEPTSCTYRIGQESWSLALPAASGARRIAYTACNGTEEEDEDRVPARRNLLWRQLAAEHESRPFCLLLQGGDQLYADTIWEDVPSLGAWQKLGWKAGNAAPFTAAMAEGAAAYYRERYRWVWTQPEIATALAHIPSVMMWDDHDVFDGWGSWPPERQDCPVFHGVAAAARDGFSLFQLAATPDDLPPGFADRTGGHFGCVWSLGGIALLVPDLRSERTAARVMGEAGWRALERSLQDLRDCRHLLVMSSVPLINTSLGPIERLLVAIPGHQNLQDDLRDQWQSYAHREEWRRILTRLADFAEETGACVTSLSGEIHLGALGLVVRGATRIHELTSSGIVNPPPSSLVVAAYDLLGRQTIHLAPDLTAKLLTIPGHGKRYLRARNRLSLDLDGRGGLDATWHTASGPAGRLTLDARPEPAAPG